MQKIAGCRICGSTNLDLYFNLGEQPWCNNFLTLQQVGYENYYPLQVAYCHNCSASQLLYTVPRAIMFSHHTYVSGTTKTLSKHFYEIAQDVVKTFDVKKDDLILDIGGNDGTNLLQYKKLGLDNLLNVESATNISQLSEQNNIKTINRFFDDQLEIDAKAKVINASGVFFHLENLHSVCRAIKNILADDGVFVVQFMYLGDIVKNLSFDGIYHEHLLYYTKKSLCHLLRMYDLYPSQFYHSEIHGGSIMAYFTKKEGNVYYKDGRNLDYEEQQAQLSNLKTYYQFADRVSRYKSKFYKMIEEIFKSGKTIVGYGSPAKSNTLINYTGISPFIKYIEEANQMKCGLYTPESHIEIKHFADVKERPDYYIVFSWNFLKEFIQKEKNYFENGGHFIVPFPNEPFIIDKNNYVNYSN